MCDEQVINMYPWYRDSVGQFCSPNTMPATIKTENGYNDCMLALDYAAQSKKGGLVWSSDCGGSGGGSVATNSRCGGGSGPHTQQGQGLVHWMSFVAEHMNTAAAHDSVPPHYMWNGSVEQCGPHGKEEYGWARQSMVKQGYEAKMNEQNNQGMHKVDESAHSGGVYGGTPRTLSSGSSSASPPASVHATSASMLIVPHPWEAPQNQKTNTT